MKNGNTIFLLSAILMLTHSVTGQVMQVNGIEYAQSLPDESSIVKFPDWNPMTESCPLEPSEAIQLASKWLLTSVPYATNLVFSSIIISKDEEYFDEWVYKVYFKDQSDQIFGDWASVLVYFDGTIPPTKAIKKRTSPSQRVDPVESGQSPELVKEKDSIAREQLGANTPCITNELSIAHAAGCESSDIYILHTSGYTNILAENASVGDITHACSASGGGGVYKTSISNAIDSVVFIENNASSNGRGFQRKTSTKLIIPKQDLPFVLENGWTIFKK